MRILIIANTYYPYIVGGGEISTRLMAEGLASRGHQVEVLCAGFSEKRENINGVIVHRRFFGDISPLCLRDVQDAPAAFSASDVSLFKQIACRIGDVVYSRHWYYFYKRFFEVGCYDLIHIAAPLSYMGFYNCVKASKNLGIPTNYAIRSPALTKIEFGPEIISKVYRVLNRRTLLLLTSVMSPTEYMIGLHRQLGFRLANAEVIRNAIDLDLCPSVRSHKPNRRILYAGKIIKEKGIQTLIKAAELVGGVELVLVGDGEMTEYVRKHEFTHHLEWTDQKRLFELMASSSIVVLPSEYEEAFGRVLIESIGCGTIAIGSDRGGIPEVLNYDSRFIFPAGSVEELASMISCILGLSEDDYYKLLEVQTGWLANYDVQGYIESFERYFLGEIEKRH